MELIKPFITAFICTIVLDIIWLGFIAKNLYDKQIGFLLRKTNNNLTPVWSSAVVVYIAIALGITLFVLPKARDGLQDAFVWGAIFGAIMYMIYDFTNHATLANWPYQMVFMDVLWGTFLCGTVSLVTAYIVS